MNRVHAMRSLESLPEDCVLVTFYGPKSILPNGPVRNIIVRRDDTWRHCLARLPNVRMTPNQEAGFTVARLCNKPSQPGYSTHLGSKVGEFVDSYTYLKHCLTVRLMNSRNWTSAATTSTTRTTLPRVVGLPENFSNADTEVSSSSSTEDSATSSDESEEDVAVARASIQDPGRSRSMVEQGVVMGEQPQSDPTAMGANEYEEDAMMVDQTEEDLKSVVKQAKSFSDYFLTRVGKQYTRVMTSSEADLAVASFPLGVQILGDLLRE